MGVLYDLCRYIKEDQTMNDVLSPEEFEERMLTINETVSMKSERTYQMHLVVVELLTDLGYEMGADIYAESVND